VPRFPRDRIAESHKALGRARDHALVSVRRGIEMKLDAQRQVEAALRRRRDDCLERDQNE